MSFDVFKQAFDFVVKFFFVRIGKNSSFVFGGFEWIINICRFDFRCRTAIEKIAY